MKEVGFNFLLSSALFLLLWSKQVKIFVKFEKYFEDDSTRPGDPVHGPDQPPGHGLLRVAVLAVPGLGGAAGGAAARPRRGLAQPRQAAAARAAEGGDTVQYSTAQYSSTVQYSTVQYSTAQHSTVLCRW